MPEFELRLAKLVQSLGDGSLLGEALLFPEVSCCASQATRLNDMIRRRVADLLKNLPADEFHRRRIGELPEIHTVDVEVPPLADSFQRPRPVVLRFHYVKWSHNADGTIAYVPALGIEVLAENDRQLDEQLVPQIRSALLRRKAPESLRDLTMLGRMQSITVDSLPLRVNLPTAKQQAQKEHNEGNQLKSVLKKVATDLVRSTSAPIYQRDADLTRLARQLTGRIPRSVLLSGRSGVGKTALVVELARRPGEFGLAGKPFWTTSGSRLMAGASGFGMWQKQCQELVREAAKTKAIMHLDNLVELIEVGKGGGNTQGIAAMLRPAIARGSLLAVAECTPEQLAVVERNDPQLLEAFAVLDVAESNADQTRQILAQVALDYANGAGHFLPALPPARRKGQARRQAIARRAPPNKPGAMPTIDGEALATLDRLHRRYATYSASPGRPLRFLRNLLDDRAATLRCVNGASQLATGIASSQVTDSQVTDSQVTASQVTASQVTASQVTGSQVTAAFSRETGLPLLMLDDEAPLDLQTTKAWFAQRVVGQPAAVELVVSLLASVKAGLTRGGKPIGSLLFIGPTGVGKTEMAKALAEFLYQDPGRMIRFDMSEYAHPAAVERLIGGTYSSRGLLTQKVRDQPFMVVLLDEFEKADPSLFDVLLQVLGEGRLTDGAGRVADFTNSVVIMTSNLGAETYRRTMLGFAGEGAAVDSAGAHFDREVKAFLRPEMYNRLDQIVPFLPLDRQTIAKIARREVERVNSRDGLARRGVSLNLDEAAIEYLAAAGFDPRYGARPLKRAIERQLMAPLAERLIAYDVNQSIDCRVDVADKNAVDRAIAVAVSVRPAKSAASDDLAACGAAIGRLLTLRRQTQRLEGSGLVLRLRNEIIRIKQTRQQRERQAKKRGRELPFRYSPELAQLSSMEKLLERVDRLSTDVTQLEDKTLDVHYAGRPVWAAELLTQVDVLQELLHELLFDLDESSNDRNGLLTLAIYGQSHHHVLELSDAYEAIVARHAGRVLRYWLKIYRSDLDQPADKLAREKKNGNGTLLPVMHLKSRKLHDDDTPKKCVDVYCPAADQYHSPPEDCIGVALQITGGRRSMSLLEPETGRHSFVRSAAQAVFCYVETAASRLLDYDPPANAGRSGALNDLPLRRTFDASRELCVDARLQEELPTKGLGLGDVVARAAEKYLEKRCWALLE